MKDVIYFLIICFGITYSLDFLLYLSGGLLSSYAIVFLLASMFIPSLSAYIVVKKILHKSIYEFGIKRCHKRYYIYALGIILLILGLGSLFTIMHQHHTATSTEELKYNLIRSLLRKFLCNEHVDILFKEYQDILYVLFLLFVFTIITAPLINFIPALGEEFGWRGYLLNRLLSSYNFVESAILVGIVWGLWHAPLILMGYNYPKHPNFIGILAFTTFCVALSICFSWLRVISNSVYPVALAHATLNSYGPLAYIILSYEADTLFTLPAGVSAILSIIITDIILLYLSFNKIRLYSRNTE